MTHRELAELRHQRADAYHTMEAALAEGTRDSMDSEQRQKYDDAERRFDALSDKISAAETDLAADRAGGTMLWDGSRGFLGAQSRGARMEGPYLARNASMADWAEARGADPAEAEGFRLGAAVRGLVTGSWDGADAERRALSSGASATGGVLVPTVTSAQVIDALTDRATCLQAGARIVPMESETKKLPKVTTLPAPGWRAQNDPVANSEPGFDGITLEAKSLAVICDVPFELFEDVSAEASAAIEGALITSLALELDRAAYYADGTSNQPTGLLNTTGVTKTAVATDGAVPTDYSALVAAYFGVRRRNAVPSAAVYAERTAETFAGLTDSTGQPLQTPPALADLEHFSTNAIATDEDEGTTLDSASSLIVGDFSQLAIGFRPSVGFRVLSANKLDTMQVQVLAFLRADVGVIYPAAFDVRTGILA